MFDDPKRELKRLERELLAEEEEYLDEEDWLEEELAEAKALSGYEEEEEPIIYRNYANGYGAQVRNYANGYGAQVRNYANGYGRYPQTNRRPVNDYKYPDEPEEEEVVYKEKGIGGQVFLTCLLTLGIVAVAGYWILVLL